DHHAFLLPVADGARDDRRVAVVRDVQTSGAMPVNRAALESRRRAAADQNPGVAVVQTRGADDRAGTEVDLELRFGVLEDVAFLHDAARVLAEDEPALFAMAHDAAPNRWPRSALDVDAREPGARDLAILDGTGASGREAHACQRRIVDAAAPKRGLRTVV